MSENTDTYDVVLTDFTLHVAERRNPPSLWRTIQKAVRNGTNRFRFYPRHGTVVAAEGNTIEMVVDFSKHAEEARRQGKKLNIILPKGTPLIAGADTMEYLESQKRKSARIQQQ